VPRTLAKNDAPVNTHRVHPFADRFDLRESVFGGFRVRPRRNHKEIATGDKTRSP
jgi:hypothetical protein